MLKNKQIIVMVLLVSCIVLSTFIINKMFLRKNILKGEKGVVRDREVKNKDQELKILERGYNLPIHKEVKNKAACP